MPEAGLLWRIRKGLAAGGQRLGLAPFLLAGAFVCPLPSGGGAHIAGVPSLCLFQQMTGLPCPGCGLTRSVVCMAHGHLADALAFHPLGPLMLAALIYFSLLRVPTLKARLTLAPRVSKRVWVAVTVLYLAVGVARLGHALPWPP